MFIENKEQLLNRLLSEDGANDMKIKQIFDGDYICGDCSWDYICKEKENYAGEVSSNYIVRKHQV